MSVDGNPVNIPFVQAKFYRKGRSSRIRGWTVHDMEAPENVRTAENVADYFARTVTRPSSAHYNIDSDSIVQSVRDGDTAYHAPGASHCHIGAEHAGYATQRDAEWRDPYSWAMLQRSAGLLAAKAKQYLFPIGERFLTVDQLKSGNFDGVTTHGNVSLAFHKSDHSDPGKYFPEIDYLKMAREGAHVVTPPKPLKVWGPGDRNDAGLLFLQRLINPIRMANGFPVLVSEDGNWDDQDTASTIELQRHFNIPQTGVLDERTVGILAFWGPPSIIKSLQLKLNLVIPFLKINVDPKDLPAWGTWDQNWFFRLAAFQAAVKGMQQMSGQTPLLNVDGDYKNIQTLNYLNYWWLAATGKL